MAPPRNRTAPEILPPRDDAAGLDPEEVSITWIGTATTLLRLGGFVVLTDPNFLHQGDHVPLGYGLRSRRLTEPAMELGELPEIDFVVLSHHHGDHFDDVAAAGLDKDLPIVTTGHAARKLRRQGFTRPIELDTWASASFGRGDWELSITALPAQHAPGVLRRALPPVMGSMLELKRTTTGATELRLYISGDTLLHDDSAAIPARYPAIDMALVHLGGTRVLGVMVTLDGRDGVRALELIRPDHAIPIHHGDYTVFKSPLSDFLDAARNADLPTELHVLDRGESHRFRLS
jgi:L-ascorbate metabolism protein UlaG (beta-lactamase superfamily)